MYCITHVAKSLTVIRFAIILVVASASLYSNAQTMLMRQPTISQERIAFVYGGDIWVANQDGSEPRHLTTHPAIEERPRFSPDGNWVAFTAAYENNRDVYVISVDGGQARRLTWHPGTDDVIGWNPDGSRILFTSPREIRNSRSAQLFQISIEGGFPEKVMDAVAVDGAWSEDGTHIAYQPYWAAHRGTSGWRLHRGGATPPIWIIDTQSNKVEKIPHPRANDLNPMWRGNNVYFVSDRDDQAANLYSYDLNSKQINKLTEETNWDIRGADIHNEKIIYQAGGRLKIYNLATNRLTELTIQINPDSEQTRPQWKKVASNIQNIELSPTAQRALVTARGEIFTVPLKEGSTRNLTGTSGVRESDAIWSPRGDKIAYISDAGSVHTLVVVPQTGRGNKQAFLLGETDYYSLLAWGVNGEKIVYEDNHLNLYVIDIVQGERTLIRTDLRRAGSAVAVSPDGKWLAYTQTLPNFLSKIKLYEFESQQSFEVTDGMSFAWSPAFSRDGEYLFFTASTNAGPSQVGLDMSTQEKPLRNAIYALVLSSDGKSPILPPTGDEEIIKLEDSAEGGVEEGNQDVVLTIALENLQRRLVALPVPERNYSDLSVAEDGTLYFLDRRQPGVSNDLPSSEQQAVHGLSRFDFESKKMSLVKEDVANYIMSADGKKLLIQGPNQVLLTADIAEEIKPESLNTSDIKAFIEPRAEWQQIFDEVWRMEQQFFYAENMHGLDWKSIREKYEPLLSYVTTREDLNLLLVEMIAELQVGHNRIGGGDVHREDSVAIGLLGADLRVENNRYRVAKIYTGEQWNPFLKAPLSPPGIGVSEGDYILSINGVELDGNTNIYSLLAQTVGKQVALEVNDATGFENSREIIVEPIENETALRRWNWIEENRLYVEEKTDGRVGYIYLPDTAAGGFTYFNRMFFAQVDKEAMIIDERRNGGGQAANYITDILGRNYLASWRDRDGLTFDTPGGAIYGPKVMLVDQDAGSGGDFLPYAFKRQQLGTLIGTRTWGGLIGISANPSLIDGGSLVVPYFRFYTPDGDWRIENEGVMPDIEVALEPDAYNRGIDSQLERSIEEIMAQLEGYESIRKTQPPALPTVLGQ